MMAPWRIAQDQEEDVNQPGNIINYNNHKKTETISFGFFLCYSNLELFKFKLQPYFFNVQSGRFIIGRIWYPSNQSVYQRLRIDIGYSIFFSCALFLNPETVIKANRERRIAQPHNGKPIVFSVA